MRLPEPTITPDSPLYAYPLHLAADSKDRPKGERTRAQIQIAACGVLDRTGPQDVTVAAVCAAAGISNGTFYIYFPDLHALLESLLTGFVAFLQSSMRAAGAVQPGFASRAATGAYYQLFRQNPGLMRCLVHHLDGFPEARTAFHRLNRDWVETVVAAARRRLLREGRGDAIPLPELTRRAHALGGMVDQYLSNLLLSQDPHLTSVSQDPGQVLDTLTLIWERGMSI